jgi:hypothetical protein
MDVYEEDDRPRLGGALTGLLLATRLRVTPKQLSLWSLALMLDPSLQTASSSGSTSFRQHALFMSIVEGTNQSTVDELKIIAQPATGARSHLAFSAISPMVRTSAKPRTLSFGKFLRQQFIIQLEYPLISHF